MKTHKLVNKKLYKIFHWEYWPLPMFYIPNIPYALFHGLLARNFVFYTVVNPGIRNSGIGSESKFRTLQILPKKYIPKSVLYSTKSDLNTLLLNLKNNDISFPIIAKPDIGFRGMLVKKIDSQLELENYLQKYPVDFLLQEYLTEAEECGIFYFRYPNQKEGKVTSITLKEFLCVIGDGNRTIEELVLENQRAKLYYKLLQENSEMDWNHKPKSGEEIQLSVIGNHSKGTRFIDGNHLITEKLTKALNDLNLKTKGWYYGRLDIKYNTFEELCNGQFKVLELNGILAEPTHIYDTSTTTYWSALKTIRNHWKELYRIARYNHDREKISYRKTFPFVKEMIELKQYSNRLKRLAKS